MNEIWVQIAGFDGRYEVSNLGRVRSIGWIVNRHDGTKAVNPPRVLKQTASGRGYLKIGLYLENGKRIQRNVHRLVAETFIPGDHSLEVNHIDLNKSNNAVSNLEWLTQQENALHAKANGRYAVQHTDGRTLASINPNRAKKLKLQQVLEIRSACAAGVPQSKTAKKYSITQAVVSKIKRGAIWGSKANITQVADLQPA